MEIIFVGDSKAKFSESFANWGINMNDITYAQFTFYRHERIAKVTSSNIIGQASISGTAKERVALFRSSKSFYIEFIDIITPYSGYAILNNYYRHNVNSFDELKTVELGKVFPNLDSCLSFLLPKADLNVDPFTKSKNLIWNDIWNDGFTYHIANASLDVSLEFKEDHSYICFSTDKDIRVQQGDTISLLFEGGSIVDYPIQKKTLQKDERFDAYCELYQDDIELFINEKCCQYRITYCKGNKAPLTGVFVDDEYSPYEHELFSAYAKQYLNELARLVPDYELPCRKIDSNAVGYAFNWCFVYLMRDNTNGYHKIGISNKPEYREKTLQSEKPSIEMLACKKFPTRKIAEAIESALHTAYSQQRVRGEWFNLKDEDVAAIIETLK